MQFAGPVGLSRLSDRAARRACVVGDWRQGAAVAVGRIIGGDGCTLYQGLAVHADGRFVADLEMGGEVVRALRMARSDAAEGTAPSTVSAAPVA